MATAPRRRMAAHRWTVREVLALPEDGNKYEVIHGELFVSPAPAQPHQLIVMELNHRLALYLEPLGLRRTLFCVAAAISWSDDTMVQPDILVVPPGEITGEWRDCKTLRLAVEVLSPGSRRRDRVIKRELYQEYDVGTYWIVDHQTKMVEVWRPGDEEAEIVHDVLRWTVVPHASALSIPLTEVWDVLPSR